MPNQNPITTRDVATFPRPGTVIPASISFADKGESVTFLFSKEGSLTRSLYAVDLNTGQESQVVGADDGGNTEENLSDEEKLERERRRERGLGVTRYAWSKEGERLLVPLGGALHLQRGMTGERSQVALANEAPALSPKLSQDGKMLAYVQDNDIWVVSTEKGSVPRQLTFGGSSNRVHGLAEYIAQEEMARYDGFWWSKDGSHIAFTEVDETHIPAYRIMHQGSESTGQSAQEDHGYPFAGQANAKVKLGVVPSGGGEPTWMDLGPSEDIYLARVHWMPDGQLWAQIENREQSQLDLLRFDLKTGASTRVLRESSEVWINLHNSFRPLATGGFLWASERSGYKHLYLYDAKGALLKGLSTGDWLVDEIVGVSEETQQVYFLAGKDDPRQSQLYALSFSGGEPRQITQGSGTHHVKLSEDCTRFIDTYSDLQTAPTVTVRNTSDGSVVRVLFDEIDPKASALKLTAPKLVTLKSRDGVSLYGAIYTPPSQFTAPYPTIVSVYGGPHAQRVTDSWDMTVDLRAQWLANQGYLVFKLDNRGSARRGLAFEGALKHDMGRVEVADQEDGVRWLQEQGLCDPERVGIFGWSYGGYMSAMALARAPETFHVGVAGAPVTHWDGYDTHYTERYMGTPQTNPKGYEESSVMHHVDGIVGDLMLVHGLIDENVHFRHTARLINALIVAQKNYELLLFPNERHMPRSIEDREYMEIRMEAFLRDKLYNRKQ